MHGFFHVCMLSLCIHTYIIMKLYMVLQGVAIVQRGGLGTCDMAVGGVEVEEMQTLKYLAVMFNKEGSCNDKIGNRIGAAARIVGA